MDSSGSNSRMSVPTSPTSQPAVPQAATGMLSKPYKLSRSSSRTPSGTTSPIMSRKGSMADISYEYGMDRSVDRLGDRQVERPVHKRQRSIFGRQHQRTQRPKMSRAKSSGPQAPLGDSAVPSNAIARLAQRTQNNLRMWYLRRNNAGSKRRTEMENLREMEKSQLLFAQMFAVTPLVVLGASSLQAEEGHQKKVPVVLQQLSIRAVEEPAKKYKNMLRISLEYGAGLGMVKWEILRGYRDFLYLRAKLKSKNLHLRSKRPKLPKLPRPKSFGLREHKFNNRDESDGGSSDEEYSGYDSEEDEESDEGAFDEREEEKGFHFDSTSNDLQNSGRVIDISIDTTPPVSNGLSITNDGRQLDTSSRLDYPYSHNSHHSHSSYGTAHSHSSTRSRNSKEKRRKSYSAAVEDWLNRIKIIYTLRSDSNDLMQFLELSHLSLKLAPEYSFHGKEGTLIVRSRASDLGWRVGHWHPQDLKSMVDRHTKKWVLVRDSYLVIVDNIYSTKIREVYLADTGFSVKHISEEEGDEIAYQVEQHNLDAVGRALPDARNVHKRTAAKSVFLHLKNNERDLKLAASTDRDLRRWQASILQMKSRSPWTKKNRFDSFAPVRSNVFGQWFVDGRDYMWVLSEALENARDTVFILDWWLSPELYLRRPPEGNQKWRLDRVLKRKAQQGVKIFVIVYKNVGATIPIDSMWTKHSLLDLHENVHVMRSPNQMSNSDALFWAHHEKLVVIDNTVAFNGGIDLCFGRWDTWQHTLTDDAVSSFLPKEPNANEWTAKTQLFPGKDYSNARVKDFFELNRPFDDMYDRNNTPRMPWHDIHQMVMGQPARDFARHFIQRWNYVLRQKIPSRPTPLLLPPSDLSAEDLERLQLTGSCEYQVLRSSGEWSIGLKEHEQSIQNAYLQLIEESEHLVYIENQFFITSTKVDGVMIENQVGNALVQRIIRAHEHNEPWKAFILIPLMPGFEADVDSDKASSVRVICQCQFNSISRGPHSIFYRLERMGIRPDHYIHFFSLRKWGKFSDTEDSPNGGRIATELLYIHAKCMIVDDRIVIIGSANINERSMRGVRDSEVAVCVRDTKVVHTKMAGRPWRAGKFAHTLRVRLMREHLGVDIDKLDIIERHMVALDDAAKRMAKSKQRHYHHQHSQQVRKTLGVTVDSNQSPLSSKTTAKDTPTDPQNENYYHYPEWLYPELHSYNWYGGTPVNPGIRDHKKFSTDSRVNNNSDHKADVEGEGFDHYKAREDQGEKIKERQYMAAFPDLEMENKAREILDELLVDQSICSREQFRKTFYARLTGQDVLRPLKKSADLPMPQTDEDGLRAVNAENIPIDPWLFEDPLDDRFVNDMWLAAAERNTLIFRLVFRCQPDDEVETWKDYKLFASHLELFYQKQREDGGPNILRKSGYHEPERVDKYVLEGAIKRANSDTVRQNKIKASHANHHNHPKDSVTGVPVLQHIQDDPSNKALTEQLKSFKLNAEPPKDKSAGDYFADANSEGVMASGAEYSVSNGKSEGIFNGGSQGILSNNDFSNSAANGNETVAFPDIENNNTQLLKPSVSTFSSRRRAQTITGAASIKPSRKWGHFDHVLDAQVAEDMLQGITGHLVVFPTEWLNRELDSGNWNFQLDRLAPLEIYD